MAFKFNPISGEMDIVTSNIGELKGITAGSILFVGDDLKITEDSNLVWDNTNKNLNINGNIKFLNDVDNKIVFPSTLLSSNQQKISFDNSQLGFHTLFDGSQHRLYLRSYSNIEIFMVDNGDIFYNRLSYNPTFIGTIRGNSSNSWGSIGQYQRPTNTGHWELKKLTDGDELKLTDWNFVDINTHLKLSLDNSKIYFGTSQDMSLTYNGTDGIIKTDEIVPSDLKLITGLNKTLELDTAVWDDLDYNITNLKINPATSKPDFNTTEISFDFDDNTTETVIGTRQMKHTWKIDSEIRPHLHWVQKSLGNVMWQLEYRFIPVNGVPTSWISVINSVAEFVYSSGSLSQVTVFSPIDTSSLNLGTSFIVDVKISRLGGDVLDTLVGDAEFKSFDFHFQIDTQGSRKEFIK